MASTKSGEVQTSGTCQTCPNGSQADGCAIGAPGPPPGWNNCVIGCNPANPGDPINVGPPCKPVSSCISYEGAASAGKECTSALDSQPSATIGQVLDGAKDTPGTNGNEVNQVYYLTVNVGSSSAGAFSTGPGYIATTFNGERWYELPVSVPYFTGEINVSLGNGPQYPGAVSTGGLANSLNTWANSPSNKASVDEKDAAKGAASALGAISATARATACFNPAWDGKATS